MALFRVFVLHFSFYFLLFLRDMVPPTRCITWLEMSKRYELVISGLIVYQRYLIT